MAKLKVKESEIQRALLEYLSYLEASKIAYVVRTGAGAVKTDKGRFFKTGKPGCPDITMCYKGRYVGIEVKSATGSLSASQRRARIAIEAAGGNYFVIRSLDELRSAIHTLDKL